MNRKNDSKNDTIEISPVGYYRGEEMGEVIEVNEAFRPALRELDRFSHVLVFWWANRHDNEKDRARVLTDLPYAKGVEAGVFACRSEYRPNPIALTACRILQIDEKKGVLKLEYIDAFDGTPVLDLKPYIPVSDRIRDVEVAEWFSDWPERNEDAGEFFSNYDWGE